MLDSLRGDRVELTAIRGEDWHEHYRYLSDPQTMHHLWFLFDSGPEAAGLEAQVRDRIKRFEAMNASETGRAYAIRDGEGRIIGDCGLKDVSVRAGTGEFGIIVAREHWRCGVGMEAARLVLDDAFAVLERVTMTTTPGNDGAQALLEGLGAVLEGTQRGALPGRDGAGRVDLLMYGLERSAWASVGSAGVPFEEGAAGGVGAGIERDIAARAPRGVRENSSDPSKWGLQGFWWWITQFEVGALITMGAGLFGIVAAMFGVGWFAAPAPGQPGSSHRASAFVGYYQEEAADDSRASRVCIAAEASSFVIYEGPDGLLHGMESSLNVIFRTEGASRDSSLLCGDAAGDEPVCVYVAEWHFDEVPGTRNNKSVQMTGRFKRRPLFDRCTGLCADLAEAESRALEQLKTDIRNGYTAAECTITWQGEGRIRQDKTFGGDKERRLSSTFVLER